MNLIKKLQGLTLLAMLSSCYSGTNQNPPQNIATSVPLTGNFVLGVANGLSSPDGGCMSGEVEDIDFIVNSGSLNTTIYDVSGSIPRGIVSGNFTNPINQNNPCFTGNILSNNCGYALNGTIKFFNCSASNATIDGEDINNFAASYQMFAPNGQFIQAGLITVKGP